jgi:hypothetical protein
VDGWEYPHGENGNLNECAIDTRNLLCDRAACVRSRDIPDISTIEQRRLAQKRAVHPSLRAWARSQKHHTTDPNVHRRERMLSEVVRGSGILPSRSTSADVARGLYHERLLNSFEAEPSSEYSSSQISFCSNRPDMRRHIDEGMAAVTTLIIEFEEDAARNLQIPDTVNQEMYEAALQYMMVKEWKEETREGIRLRDEAFAEWKIENQTTKMSIEEYHLARFSGVFLPARPHLLPEISGIKLQGFKRGIRYNSEAKGNGLYMVEQKSSEMHERYNKAATQSDDEEVESGYYGDGDGFNNEGMRKTQNPLDLADLRKRYQDIYNPHGIKRDDAGAEEIKRKISEHSNDVIPYVQELDNIPWENIAAYEGKKANTMIKAKSRRAKEIAEDVRLSSQNGHDKFICSILDKMYPNGAEHKDGFYLLVRFPRRPPMLYPLSINFTPCEDGCAEYDEDEMEKAIHDLWYRVARDSAYKMKGTGDYDKDCQLGRELGNRVWDVFSRAKFYYFVFDPDEKEAAVKSTP